MGAAKRSLEQHPANDGLPKRILALDGSGPRGILTLAVLDKAERDLCGEDFPTKFDLPRG